MKLKFQIILSAAAASVLAFTALAQDQTDSNLARPDYTRDRLPQNARADRLNGAAKVSDIIGLTVQNLQHEKLGKVEDLAVDVESGRIVQVVLSTGGFLGLGDTLTAVPPGVLQHDAANKVIRLDISKEKLKASPRFETAKWDEGTQSNRVTEVYGYYSQEPYFISSRGPNNTPNMDTNHNADETSESLATRSLNGTSAQERAASEHQAKASWSSLGYVQQASKLMGSPVKNLQEEKLGKVENLIVDLSAGRIVAVIISSGGFLGLGGELSAVPPIALRLNAEHDTLQLDTSKEMLASSPHFKSNEWPDLSQPGYVGGIYHAYKVEPYFTTDTTNAADNTRLNVRDRDSRTLTPLDQGNGQADVTITSEIRKAILADKAMSVNARNVKIITQNGQVTLRGPVGTAKEKSAIAEIANRVANPGNVDNQLELAPATTGDDK